MATTATPQLSRMNSRTPILIRSSWRGRARVIREGYTIDMREASFRMSQRRLTLDRQYLQNFFLNLLPRALADRAAHARLEGDARRAVAHQDAVADLHRLADVVGDEHGG